MPALKFAISPDRLAHAVQASARRKLKPLSGQQLDDAMVFIVQGVSPCCRAELDESDVEPRGQKRGEGPRYCKACGEEVFRA